MFQKRDCFACAPTGSGKTLAFLCPMLMKIKVSLLYMDYHLPGLKNGVKAVVLCPTRELAAQTARECKKLAKGRKFYIKLMTKELSRCGDFEKMPCDIIISTPLRLDFAICKRKLDLSRYELKKTLTTFDRNSASEMIKQKLVFAGSERGKLLAIRQSFAESLNPPVLVFVQSKERAKELYKELAFDDIKVDVIHADLSQQQFIVFLLSQPSGRSGRAGRPGQAVTFFTEEDKPFLRNIANVMAASGCEVPSWILALPKLRKRKHRPQRDSISTIPDDSA
ncbi:hypothetical protein B296_00035248 [Ensete ventricosum]|uniref:RNA helicase n=1 Tax=Ensete ventricosum TaxID=4639 RepID=A0A426YI84_ENSVE|nr:hypothetical protein B296_00035248 [Ensete ventricosum]